MECNKDEAKKAMDVAERKIIEKDYNGAKYFANKAQNLFPELDGLKQLLTAIDVYISGEKQICGEADWYGILGVDPIANDEAVKKQYRKLILMLHPDKNKCQGAEGAYNLVSHAWNLLSDEKKRCSYDEKRSKQVQQRFPTTKQSRIPPHHPASRGSSTTQSIASAARMDTFRVGSVSSMMLEQSNYTFWTKCGKCNTLYEYPRVYLNQNLLCPSCSHGFVAQEITPPLNVPKPPVNLSSNQQHMSWRNQVSSKKSYGLSSTRRDQPAPSVNNHNFQWDSSSRMAGYYYNSRNATNQAENVDLRDMKRSKIDDSYMRGQTSARNVAYGNTETLNTLGSLHPRVQETLLPYDITKVLMDRGQSEIFKRLPKMISEMEAKVRVTEGEKKSMKATSKTMSGKTNEVEEVKTIIVPDSEFHNFDLDRSESCFKEDQIWAAYDNDDGMPRFYACVQKVISLEPFKMNISWLYSKSTSDIDWLGSGFAKTCGDYFKPGRYESTDTVNAFSHKVDFTKDDARGLLHILPKKGQVWALYRNWSLEWDKNTPDEVKHKYEMVQVLDDYTEDKQSVSVALLLKAEGFRAVFRRSIDGNDVREIPNEEMFRFSHQVPHYILTGKEAGNAPEGCLELDPAATPCEFFSNKEEVNEKRERSYVPGEEVGMDLD